MEKIRALLLGGASSLSRIILSLWRSGIEPVVVNTDPVRFFDKVPALPIDLPVALNLYQNVKIPALKFSRYLFTVIPNNLLFFISQRLIRLLKEIKVDFVLAHWGCGVLPEIALIKGVLKLRNLPLIINMETFPTAPSSGLREMIELRIFKRMAQHLDGLIIPTPEMADLIFKLEPAIKKKTYWIKPMYYPSEYTPIENLPRLSEIDKRAHVVFVGRFDMKHSINDVRGELLSLAESGIFVHCAVVNGLSHQNIIQFHPSNVSALAPSTLTGFMTQFDACLVTYNLNKRNHGLRFQTSLPARFLIALAAGIPVIFPRGKFRAIENFVKHESIGYAFESADEVLSALMKLNWKEIQQKSKSKQMHFTFDHQGFLWFIYKLLQSTS